MNFKQRFVVLDIETTGLNYEYFDEPTEIALIEIIDGKLTGKEEHFYLKPKKVVTLKFLQKVFGKNLAKDLSVKDFDSCKEKIDKIEDELIKNKKMEEYNEVLKLANEMYNNISKGDSKYKVLPKIRDFVGDSIVIGHNVQFDVNFLNYWFNSLGITLIQNYICTMNSFKDHFKPKLCNLGVCCDYYDISLIGAHNALVDTKACAYLFLKEIEDFPEEIFYYECSLWEAYANFKKRVFKTNYYTFARMLLSEPCDIPKNIEDLDQVEIDSCKNLFFKFKKPIDVSKLTGFDLASIDAIFIDWVNCININKHQEFVKDRYLKEACLEIIKYCNNEEDLIKKCCNILFDSNPNFFYIELFNKLENRKNDMEYDLNDFDFYFKNLRNLDELSTKIGKDISYIYKFLLIWINEDTNKFLQYKIFFKENYKKNPKTIKEKTLYSLIENASNKDFLIKRIGIL